MEGYSKREFMYECAMRALQGSHANPSQQASVAAIVRDAEKLWEELQEWETRQGHQDGDDHSIN